jgi:hypothetical protein
VKTSNSRSASSSGPGSAAQRGLDVGRGHRDVDHERHVDRRGGKCETTGAGSGPAVGGRVDQDVEVGLGDAGARRQAEPADHPGVELTRQADAAAVEEQLGAAARGGTGGRQPDGAAAAVPRTRPSSTSAATAASQDAGRPARARPDVARLLGQRGVQRGQLLGRGAASTPGVGAAEPSR